VSPILVRPVREQLEHDRIIRLLPGKYRRRFEVGINPGSEQTSSIGTGTKALYPDAVLYSTERGRKLMGVVEVETGESINHLEAMAQWAHLARLRVPFHLYVPVGSVDVARRLSDDHQITVSEIWTYDHIGDQVRFTLIFKAPEHARPAAPAGAATRATTARAGAGRGVPAKTAGGKTPARKAAATKVVARKERATPPRAAAPRAARPVRPLAKGAKASPARKTSAKRPAAKRR
jgi:hypothetical protein